jgi:hypothetical protein
MALYLEYNNCCRAAERVPAAEFSCRRQNRAFYIAPVYHVKHVSSQVFWLIYLGLAALENALLSNFNRKMTSAIEWLSAI